MRISAEEAKRLIDEKKSYKSKERDNLEILTNDAIKGKVKYSFLSDDGRDEFLITFERKGIQLDKYTKGLIGARTIPLVRLDIGKPHRNPDGVDVGENHIHIYREGFDDKWAVEINPKDFPHIEDTLQTFYDFLRFCNADNFPKTQKGLFN